MSRGKKEVEFAIPENRLKTIFVAMLDAYNETHSAVLLDCIQYLQARYGMKPPFQCE